MASRDAGNAMSLQEKIRSREASVAVLGLGHVGLPLSVEIARAGYRVTGVDVDRARAWLIAKGKGGLTDIPDRVVADLVERGLLNATTSLEDGRKYDIFVICVPTGLTAENEPDLGCISEATRCIAAHLRPGQMVILESTTYPGTTRAKVRPILEQTGLSVGSDFYLAYSPERVDPGNQRYTIRNTPKLVAGVTERCSENARLFYEQFVEKVVVVSSPEAAEMTKLLENVFRYVNIALANEMMLLCQKTGLDIWEIVDAASTKPFGFMPFYPGPGVGGHCIAVDPFYLLWQAAAGQHELPLLRTAVSINQAMPRQVVERLAGGMTARGKTLDGAMVLVVGVSYKRNVADVRESPAIEIISLLAQRNARVYYHDPLVPKLCVDGKVYRSVSLNGKLLQRTDCAVIVTDHADIDYSQVWRNAHLVVDTRGVSRSLAAQPSDLGEGS